MKKLLLMLLLIIQTNVYARYETSNAFLVTIYDKYVKVVSPKNYLKKLSVIIDNKTLTKVMGRIEFWGQKKILYLSVQRQSFKTFELEPIKGERILFYPMAPAFQEVELIFGKQSYEIPAQEYR